jgi:hypothetical protein
MSRTMSSSVTGRLSSGSITCSSAFRIPSRKLQGEGKVEGGWVDRVVRLEGVRAEIAMMETPDGGIIVELAERIG